MKRLARPTRQKAREANPGEGGIDTTPLTLLPDVVELVCRAAELLTKEAHQSEGPRGNGDKAPIDTEIENFLRKGLLDRHPVGFIGEETGRTGKSGGEFWIVDPHDGTRAFLDGYGGTSVSVALLRNSIPVLGVVCAPLSPDTGFDCISWAEGSSRLIRNGKTVNFQITDRPLDSRSIVFLNHRSSESPLTYGEAVAPGRFVSLASIAYRLARVAAGDGAAAVSLNGPCALDYAAGHALLRGAGMVLLDETGSPVTYSANGSSGVSACFGGLPKAAKELSQRKWGIHREGKRQWLQGPEISTYQLDHSMLRRAKGCLLGQIIGDSLGSLVEFQRSAQIRMDYPEGVRDLADGGTWKTLAGQPTDDSELALALARSIVWSGTYTDEGAAEAYGRWYASRPFDIGVTTARALSKLSMARSDKAAAAKALADEISQSNGSLMRVSPIGIWADYPKVAAHHAGEDSRLTHPHEACVSACRIYAAAISAGVRTGSVEAMVSEANMTAEFCQSDTIRQTLAAALKGNGPKDVDGGKQGWVAIAFQNAFRHLAAGTPIEDALIETVGLGGDTDTNAAIAGALLGSVQGIEAIPSRWIRPVLACRPHKSLKAPNPRPDEYWPDDVLELAARLLTCGKPFKEPFDPED